MEAQISLFQNDLPFTLEPCKVIPFPGQKKPNYRKGEEQTVYPIKKKEQLQQMAQWFMDNADPKYLLAFTLGINLGLRANELLSLRFKDLFNPDGSIKYNEDITDTTDRLSIDQSKTKKIRGLYLNKACVSILDWCYPQRGVRIYKNDFIFPSREGGHIEVDTFRKKLKDAATACGIRQNIGTHTLRKTFGYFHYKENHDLGYLQRLFGHSSQLVTMRYIGIMDEDDKSAYHTVVLDVTESLNLY